MQLIAPPPSGTQLVICGAGAGGVGAMHPISSSDCRSAFSLTTGSSLGFLRSMVCASAIVSCGPQVSAAFGAGCGGGLGSCRGVIPDTGMSLYAGSERRQFHNRPRSRRPAHRWTSAGLMPLPSSAALRHLRNPIISEAPGHRSARAGAASTISTAHMPRPPRRIIGRLRARLRTRQ